MASSSSSLNWLYDVFVSFRGEDIRKTFLNHVFKEFDRKLINFFKDNEMVKSQSLRPVLEKAIRSSRIAVVVFSRNYASSSWCLNELLEIVDCNIKIIIPIFYGVDPSDVRNHTGYFGKIFEETCKKNNTEEVKDKWKKALTNVANMVGFDFANWDTEAKMIEEIANDVLRKLLSTSSKDFENFVGIEDHMAKMSELLQLESEEVRMVGIWGSSGIGKTIIARALFNQLPQHFHVSKFVDRSFVSRSKETYHGANPDDHNMKLHLQEQFLSNILGIKDIEIGHLGALRERLHHQKVLIIIDDLDDLMVLEVLADKTQWFGSGSRIIVVTNNRRFLRAHEIVHIYEVSLPTEVQACQMLCQSAFRENYGPEGFEELVVEVTIHAGRLPLGLNVLGCSLRGQDKEYWMDKLRELQNSLEDGIEKILRISYDGLGSNEKTLFRHIACLFNHMEETTIKLLLADSKLSVNTALPNLADRCLIHIRQGYVVMHPLLQAMCIEIVRTQSIDKPEKREFLEDKEEICYVLKEGTGTSKILGISLDTSEIHELQIHKNAFKGMGNLKFLKIYSKIHTLEKEVRLNLPESFAYWPPKLKLLSWERYPMSWLPSGIVLENLVKLEMQESKLEKLWEGVVSVPCLKEMDIRESLNLKEIPDLSMATNLVKLDFGYCSSLVELPSSIRNLNKLVGLDMVYCNSLETLPTGFDLKSLEYINFKGCKKLRTFPEFSTNISCLVLEKTKIEEFPSNLCLENLTELFISIEESDGKEWEGVKLLMPLTTMLSPILTLLKLCYIPSLRELPSSFQNLNQLEELYIGYCRNLETLPTGINLKSLRYLDLQECSLLRSFPEISTNISSIYVERTGIEEVPWRIENFSNLSILSMRYCSSLKCVSLNISKLKHLAAVDFSDCGALTSVDLSGNSSEVAMEADNIDTVPEEASSSLSDDYFPKRLNFTNCFNLDKEAVLQQQSIIFESMILAGEEVPSYFTHRTTGMFPLLDVPLSQPFFRFRVCAVVNAPDGVYIVLNCRFKGKYGNKVCQVKLPNPMVTPKGSHQLLIFDCAIPLNNAPLPLPPVDMHIYLTAGPPGWKLMFSIKGWGIRLLGNCSSPEKLIGYPNPRPWHAGTLLARKSSDSMFRNMLDEEMDLYFTYRTTGNSLYDIPLPHTLNPSSDLRLWSSLIADLLVNCHIFTSTYLVSSKNGLRYGVIKCVFPLNEGNAQPNYDHVDIKFQLRNRGDCTSSIIGCGIGFLEDCSSPSPENQIGNPNTLRLVCEADADNTISDGCHETKSSEECEDSGKGYETDQIEDCGGSDRGNETDQPPHVSEANEDNIGYIPLQELVNETEHSKDSADSNVETERSRKRIRKSWRRPKGIDFRARKKLKGVTLMPNVGYGSGHNITYGFKKFKTLLMMHKRTYSAEIAHNVSTKKRKVIVEKALG